MASIIPALTDRHRNHRNGDKRFVGQILRIDGRKLRVICEVYGATLDEMRRRKRAVYAALKPEQDKPRSP